MCRIAVLVLLYGCIGDPVSAQLSVEQREQDFRQLSSVFAKRYAPYEWKLELLKFDLFEIDPWLKRVRAAADDIEYMEICAEYVASLQDTHTSYSAASSLIARLPMFVDIYDGKVLIESYDPFGFTPNTPPVAMGDELVSIDGKPVEQIMDELQRIRRRGSTVATRRAAADLLTWRPQSAYPSAIRVPATAEVVLRKASGEEATYTVLWSRIGVGFDKVGPTPFPRQAGSGDPRQPLFDALNDMWNWSAPSNDPLLMGATYDEASGEIIPRRYLLGYGARNPVWNPPQGFQQRLGRVAADFHYSGTWESEGLKLGLIRIPNFSPPATGLQEFEREIAFMQQNTDGLVIDVMRNTGGGCHMLDAARRLIPRPFWFFGEEIRATRDRVSNMRLLYELAVLSRADQWIIDTFKGYADQLEQAHFENRGRTGPLPACVPAPASSTSTPPSFEQTPAEVVYTKPIIFLIDDFSTSAADIFPAMMQDNGRGPLVGTRTNGAGGSVSSWPLLYSENSVSNTNTLVVRREPVNIPGYPVTRYIENVGAHADIPLDYMTRENLLTRGRPFVDGFTRILVEEIRKSRQ